MSIYHRAETQPPTDSLVKYCLDILACGRDGFEDRSEFVAWQEVGRGRLLIVRFQMHTTVQLASGSTPTTVSMASPMIDPITNPTRSSG